MLLYIRLGAWKELVQEPDKKAIGNIRTAMILSVVGVVLGLIPVAGTFIEFILSIVAFVMMLQGWKLIANSAE